ncbi:hypothetical protein ACPV5H_00490 [Vibrio harveyi]|uniref:hypothetical protein n=1 Tax=Vibrio harveyi TaxID=669 RepID=UPI000648C3CB|nr:hypothetical protein [Vibrio harveyi]
MSKSTLLLALTLSVSVALYFVYQCIDPGTQNSQLALASHCTVGMRNDLDITTIFSILGGYFILVVLVERMTQVFVLLTRMPQRDTLKANVDKCRDNASLSPEERERQLSETQDELSSYRQKTRDISVLFSLSVSILLCATGVGILNDLLVVTKVQTWQIRIVDIALTASLISGGTNSFNKISSTVDAYFTRTKDRLRQ